MMRARLLIPAVAATLAWACGGATGPTAGYMELPADQLLVDVKQMLNSNGVRSALLHADTVLVFEDSAKAHLRGVFLTLYDETGAESSTVRAARGELHRGTDIMIARGNVVLLTEGGERRIETEELHYDPGRARVWSDVPFVQTYRGNISRGTAFESDDKFLNFTVQGARGTLEGLRFDF